MGSQRSQLPTILRIVLSLMALALATSSQAQNNVIAREDRLTISGSAPVLLDLLANDEDRQGRELQVDVNAAQLNGLSVVNNGDGTIIVTKTSTEPTGDVSFSYRAREPGVTCSATQTVPNCRAATVRVCWGTSACELGGTFEPVDPPEEPGACATGLCISIAGTRYLSGEVVELGTAPSGAASAPIPLTIENGTGAQLKIEAILLGDADGMKFVENDSASNPVARTMGVGELSGIDLRHVFLPTAPAGNYNSIYIEEKRTDGQTPRHWELAFHSAGEGQIVVPGYPSCELRDVCLYYNTVKLTSMLHPQDLGEVEFGAKRPGEGTTFVLTLVRNGVPGEPAIPFVGNMQSPFRMLINGSPQTSGALEARDVKPVALQFFPTKEGIFRSPVDINVGSAGGSLGFRAKGTGCLDLCFLNDTLSGVGPTVAVRNDGSADTDTVFTILNNSFVSHRFSAELKEPSLGLASYWASADACGTGSTPTKCVGTLSGGQSIGLHLRSRLAAGADAATFDLVVTTGANTQAATLHVSRCADLCVYGDNRLLATGGTWDLGLLAIGVTDARTLYVVNQGPTSVALDPVLVSTPYSIAGTAGTLAPRAASKFVLKVTPAAGNNNTTLRIGSPFFQKTLSVRGVVFAPIRLGAVTYFVPKDP